MATAPWVGAPGWQEESGHAPADPSVCLGHSCLDSTRADGTLDDITATFRRHVQSAAVVHVERDDSETERMPECHDASDGDFVQLRRQDKG